MRWIAPILLVCSLVVLVLPSSVAAKTLPLSYPGLSFHEETAPKTIHPLKLIFGLFKQKDSLMISNTTPAPSRLAEFVPLSTVSDDFLTPELKKDVVILTKQPLSSKILLNTSSTPSPIIKQVKAITILPSPTPSSPDQIGIKSGPTPTLLPTATPTPIPQKAVATNSSSIPANPTGGLNAEKLFNLVNNYHMSKGLASYQTDSRACELASARASEVGEEITNGHMHSGLRARNLPYWNSENIISYNSEEGAFNWWINDTIHREQIEADYKYSCLACVGNACAQEFTNFISK